MSDYFSDMLSVVHDTLAVPAAVQGLTEEIQMIDKSSGVEVAPSGKGVVPTLVPALCVRAAELEAAGLSIGDLIGRRVTINRKTWKVIARMPRPTPQGEDRGEYWLHVQRGA